MLQFVSFFTVVLVVLVAGHVYLYRRLVRDVTGNKRIRQFAIAGLVLLFAGVVMGRVLRNAPPSLLKSMSLIFWLWLGFALYMILPLLAVDVFRWGQRFVRRQAAAELPSPERRRFLATVAAGSAGAISSGVVGYGYWRACVDPPRIVEVGLKVANLPPALDGFTIAQLTDIHVGSLIQRRFIDEVVGRVNGLKPDLVAITGDLVDGSPEHLGHSVSGLRNLQSRYGTYFVHGNHEYYSGDVEWTRALEGMDIRVLRNRFVTLGDGGVSFDLVGVDDWLGDRRNGGLRIYDLEKAVSGRNPHRPAILLAHQPEGFERAISHGIGVQLSGHTHGGQMFPMTQLVKLRWPRDAGLYTERGHHLYISRGTGFWGPPIRVGSPPEITKVVLQPA